MAGNQSFLLFPGRKFKYQEMCQSSDALFQEKEKKLQQILLLGSGIYFQSPSRRLENRLGQGGLRKKIGSVDTRIHGC